MFDAFASRELVHLVFLDCLVDDVALGVEAATARVFTNGVDTGSGF